MPGAGADRAGVLRLRRARREDIAALVGEVGGPPALDRVRALRRLLKTLVADVYVLERGAVPLGVVAVLYRRSMAWGGLVATIDLLRVLTGCPEGDAEDAAARLADCALSRARRRGCVAVDSAVGEAVAVQALEAAGLRAVAAQRALSLRSPAPGAPSAAHELQGDA